MAQLLSALFANCFFQTVSRRAGAGLFKSVGFGFAAGIAVLVFFRAAAVDCASYFALSYCYFHFVNMGETARRIRILREIDEAGPLSLEELLGRYGGASVSAARISRLTAGGHLVFQDGKYRAGKILLFMALAVRALRRISHGEKSNAQSQS